MGRSVHVRDYRSGLKVHRVRVVLDGTNHDIVLERLWLDDWHENLKTCH
jgi:hypothetical protein